MRVTVNECDFCGRHVDPEETPLGWIRFEDTDSVLRDRDKGRIVITLTANVKVDTDEGPRVAVVYTHQSDWDFCSVECLAGYLVDAARAELGR